jgi:hypothetical protein
MTIRACRIWVCDGALIRHVRGGLTVMRGPVILVSVAGRTYPDYSPGNNAGQVLPQQYQRICPRLRHLQQRIFPWDCWRGRILEQRPMLAFPKSHGLADNCKSRNKIVLDIAACLAMNDIAARQAAHDRRHHLVIGLPYRQQNSFHPGGLRCALGLQLRAWSCLRARRQPRQ